MKRPYLSEIETTDKFPLTETRARFHRVFGTSDDDLVREGVAVRREYPRPSGEPRVIYEAASREAAAPERVEAGRLPEELTGLLNQIPWTEEHVRVITPILKMLIRSIERKREREAANSELSADAPDPALQETPRPSREAHSR